MSIQTLGTGDQEAWLSVLGQVRQHDFHHLPQYHRVAERQGEGIATFFVFREGGLLIGLPLLLRPVFPDEPDGWQDATSVYGYGGPVASHEVVPDSIRRRFQAELTEILRARRVVAVFSRLHPLIAQGELLAGMGHCPVSGCTLSIDLRSSEEELHAQYSKSCRASLRKLREAGFSVVHDRERRYLREFTEVYRETMRRVNASESYHFDQAYFDLLTQELAEASHVFVALKEGEVAAATLCTLCDGIVQDHLGGTRDAYLKFSPDRLVVDSIRIWAKHVGAHTYHLGGGVGAQEDSLFKYKSGFSSRRHPFATFRWVLHPEAYAELTARAGQDGLDGASGGFFPAYRRG